MKKIKQPTNRELWQKEINRVKRFISKHEQAGYSFENVVLPETPKRVTKQALRNLKAETTPTKLYKQAEYVTGFGEIISGTEQQKRVKERQRKERAKKKQAQAYQKTHEVPYASRLIYNNIRDFLRSYQLEDNTKLKYYTNIRGRGSSRWGRIMEMKADNANDLLSLMDEQILNEGDEFFKRMEDSSVEVNEAMQEYNRASTEQQVTDATVRFATLIKGGSLSLEESKHYTDLAEKIAGVDVV